MTTLKFPFRRLPNDICSKILKTVDPHEIIAYSFLSKKSLSLVQSLGLSLKKARISVKEFPDIFMDFGNFTVTFNCIMSKNDKDKPGFDDIPVNIVNVVVSTFGNVKSTAFLSWSTPGKTIGKFIQHICSIFRCDWYEAEFHIGKIRFDIQSLRNTFPKLTRVLINCLSMGPSEDDIQSAQNVLRAFLPHAKHFQLIRVPLPEDFSMQHIGMANLTELEIFYPQNPKLDDLLTLNAERCTINANRFSLRDMNRFFKLWTKGFFRKLKFLLVRGNVESIPAIDVLFKGLQAEEVGRETEYTILNCHGIRARIKMINMLHLGVSVQFTVSN